MEWQAKFQTRVQQRGESLVEYAGELCMLAGRAFPTWSNEQREMLTRNQFGDFIPVGPSPVDERHAQDRQ